MSRVVASEAALGELGRLVAERAICDRLDGSGVDRGELLGEPAPPDARQRHRGDRDEQRQEQCHRAREEHPVGARRCDRRAHRRTPGRASAAADAEQPGRELDAGVTQPLGERRAQPGRA